MSRHGVCSFVLFALLVFSRFFAILLWSNFVGSSLTWGCPYIGSAVYFKCVFFSRFFYNVDSITGFAAVSLSLLILNRMQCIPLSWQVDSYRTSSYYTNYMYVNITYMVAIMHIYIYIYAYINVYICMYVHMAPPLILINSLSQIVQKSIPNMLTKLQISLS